MSSYEELATTVQHPTIHTLLSQSPSFVIQIDLYIKWTLYMFLYLAYYKKHEAYTYLSASILYFTLNIRKRSLLAPMNFYGTFFGHIYNINT